MQGKSGAFLAACFGLLALSACESSDPQLMNIRTDKPDEFRILPTKPLQAPADYETLPEPTPGEANLVDPTPRADAIAALGGNAERTVNSGHGGLLRHVSRYGVPADIRKVLAAEDLEWRKTHNGLLLERLFNVNVYYSSYKPQSLDQHRELERLRKLGIWTPSAPPDPEVAVQ